MFSSRRHWLAGSTTFVTGSLGLLRAAQSAGERLGVACQLGTDEATARKALAAARSAGFRHVQLQFPWDTVSPEFLRRLPGWLREEGVNADVLGAYVNCASPETVIMGCRRDDFGLAIDYAGRLDCRYLTAWTGGLGTDLMKADARNFAADAPERIVRFLEPFLARLEDAKLVVALETYITLVCPDAGSMKALLDRLPKTIAVVLDPPNLTPVAEYPRRDAVLHDMIRQLRSRVGVVHLKDFRLAPDGKSYELPGPLDGEMNYPLYAKEICALPGAPPIIAEHVGPAQFPDVRKRLLQVFGRT